MPPAELEDPPEVGTCPRCEGRGWVLEADGGAGTARPCACRAEGKLPRLLDVAGIPDRYRGCRLDNFNVAVHGSGEQLVRARSLSTRYVDEFLTAEGGMRSSGLLFVGPPGVGKTHLAAAILLELIRRYRVRGRFVDFTTLIYQIQSTFDPGSPESKSAILDPVIRAEVLVLDELGAQKPSPWVSEILYLVLNSRYTRRLPTLFTTNYRLDPEEAEAAAAGDRLDRLSSRIPAMLVSRLYEMAHPITIESVDFRRVFKSHQHRL